MGKRRKRTDRPPSERQLLRQLETAPLVDVLGVLAAIGVGGCSEPRDRLWTLVFEFASWRIVGGPLRTEELYVRRKVQERQIRRYQNLIKPDVVTRIRARVVEESLLGHPAAYLVKVVGQDDSDTDLNAEVKRLRQPIKMKDKTFGTFTLDRRFKTYEGRAIWNGHRVQVSIAASEPHDVERALSVARRLWRAQKSWHKKTVDYAVRKLLPWKNADLLENGERQLTIKQFQARIKLVNITVYPEAAFMFCHDDGDLFGGHSIEIRGSLAKGLYDIDTPG